jgi:hypothetical protein
MYCTFLILGSYFMPIRVDHTKSKAEAQEEQSSGEYGGPQAPSGEDTNIVFEQGKPWCI